MCWYSPIGSDRPACVEVSGLPLARHCKDCLILRLEAAEHDAEVREKGLLAEIAHLVKHIDTERRKALEVSSCA